MLKEHFKYLYSFKYNNKEYIYLTNKNYPFYFLEYNYITKKFDYPDINTFISLYNKFYSNELVLAFNIKNNLKLIKEKLSNININIIPLIKNKKVLVSITLVLSMCACNQTNDIKVSNNNENIITNISQDKSQEIYNYFKNYNMDVIDKEYDGNDYIFVKSFINKNNKTQITLQNLKEFREFNNINFIPTWSDVIEAFQNNENIDKDKLNIILECINNMKNNEELKNLDLSVLYVNAKRMKFEYLSNKDIINKVNSNAYAYFDTVSGTVYLPKDLPFKKFEFIHEVLGHGSLAYRKETENSLIVFDCTNYLMLLNDNRYTGYNIGKMISEGGANMIAHLATKDYSVDSFYQLYEEELRVIAKLCHVSIADLFNNKGIDFYDFMYKNGINTPVEYIFKMDSIYNGQLYCEFSDLMERLFIDATEEEFTNLSKEEQDEIIKSTIEIILDSDFKDKKELNFDYSGGSINYNFEESAKQYEESMNKLRNNK